MTQTRQHGWVRNLVTIQVQDRKHRAIANGIEKFVRMPTGRQWPCLSLTIADHAARDEIGIVKHRAVSMHQRITQLSSFMNRARRFRRDVTGDSAGKGKLPEQLSHPFL